MSNDKVMCEMCGYPADRWRVRRNFVYCGQEVCDNCHREINRIKRAEFKKRKITTAEK